VLLLLDWLGEPSNFRACGSLLGSTYCALLEGALCVAKSNGGKEAVPGEASATVKSNGPFSSASGGSVLADNSSLAHARE
jgi:hypothetical protein